jgi:hypothetical protein
MCDCVDKINTILKSKRLQLALAFIFQRQSHNIITRLYITTEEIGPHVRGFKTDKIMVSYCPFCGEKIESLETAETRDPQKTSEPSSQEKTNDQATSIPCTSQAAPTT